MKAQLLFLITFVFYCLGINAQTDIGGTITNDSTLTIEGSPYFIVGNFGVPADVTLTVNPGVIINYNDDYQIIIQGTLIANGDSVNPIVFNGNVAGSAMILFQKTDLNNSSLSYITLYGPKEGIQLSKNDDDNNSGTLMIDYLTINESKITTKGYESNSKLVIDNAIITNTMVFGDYPLSEEIRINNSTISGGQIWSNSYNFGIYLESCTSNNTFFATGCCGASINVSESIIYDASFNEQGGQPGDFNYLNIDNSDIFDSKVFMPVSTVSIYNSNFNYSSSYSDLLCIVSGNGVIDYSTFNGNGSLIAIERGPGNFSYDNNSSFIISYCTFSGFGTDIKINSGEDPGTGSGAVSVKYCDFLDTPEDYIVHNNSPYEVMAKNNWWGTTETTEIDILIYDFFNDIAFGEVIYTDYLLQPVNPTVGIQKIIKNLEFDISIFPNPLVFQTTLKSNINLKNATLTLYNSQGQEVFRINNISGKEIKLYRNNLKNDAYFIRLSQGNQILTTSKLIVVDYN